MSVLKAKGQRKTQDPCEACGMHRERCICAHIPKLDLPTRLSLVIHAKELKRTTNTGALAAKALLNSEVIVRGQIGQAIDLSRLIIPEYQNLFLYPSENAVVLTKELVDSFQGRPVHLIVPDGNWRQAGKVHYRHKELGHLQRVMIKAPPDDDRVARPAKAKSAVEKTLRLRAESSEDGMATLQAIAYAFGVLESDAVMNELLKLFQLKLMGTIQGRGQAT